METAQNLNIFENGLDERSSAYLLETTRWTKFLAIMGFIFIGFMLLVIALMMFVNASDLKAIGGIPSYVGILMIMFYVLIAVALLLPAVSLLKFSTNMKTGIQTKNIELVSEGFRHQKNLFKYTGIITIILIVINLLMYFLLATMTKI